MALPSSQASSSASSSHSHPDEDDWRGLNPYQVLNYLPPGHPTKAPAYKVRFRKNEATGEEPAQRWWSADFVEKQYMHLVRDFRRRHAGPADTGSSASSSASKLPTSVAAKPVPQAARPPSNDRKGKIAAGEASATTQRTRSEVIAILSDSDSESLPGPPSVKGQGNPSADGAATPVSAANGKGKRPHGGSDITNKRRKVDETPAAAHPEESQVSQSVLVRGRANSRAKRVPPRIPDESMESSENAAAEGGDVGAQPGQSEDFEMEPLDMEPATQAPPPQTQVNDSQSQDKTSGDSSIGKRTIVPDSQPSRHSGPGSGPHSQGQDVGGDETTFSGAGPTSHILPASWVGQRRQDAGTSPDPIAPAPQPARMTLEFGPAPAIPGRRAVIDLASSSSQAAPSTQGQRRSQVEEDEIEQFSSPQKASEPSGAYRSFGQTGQQLRRGPPPPAPPSNRPSSPRATAADEEAPETANVPFHSTARTDGNVEAPRPITSSGAVPGSQAEGSERLEPAEAEVWSYFFDESDGRAPPSIPPSSGELERGSQVHASASSGPLDPMTQAPAPSLDIDITQVRFDSAHPLSQALDTSQSQDLAAAAEAGSAVPPDSQPFAQPSASVADEASYGEEQDTPMAGAGLAAEASISEEQEEVGVEVEDSLQVVEADFSSEPSKTASESQSQPSSLPIPAVPGSSGLATEGDDRRLITDEEIDLMNDPEHPDALETLLKLLAASTEIDPEDKEELAFCVQDLDAYAADSSRRLNRKPLHLADLERNEDGFVCLAIALRPEVQSIVRRFTVEEHEQLEENPHETQSQFSQQRAFSPSQAPAYQPIMDAIVEEGDPSELAPPAPGLGPPAVIIPAAVVQKAVAEAQTGLDLYIALDEASQNDLEQTRAALRQMEESQAKTAALYSGALQVIAEHQARNDNIDELKAERDKALAENAKLRRKARESEATFGYMQVQAQGKDIELTGLRGSFIELQDDLSKKRKQLKQGLAQAHATYASFRSTQETQLRLLQNELALAKEQALRTEGVRMKAARADRDQELRIKAQAELRNYSAASRVELEAAQDQTRMFALESHDLKKKLGVMTARAEGAEARAKKLEEELRRESVPSESSSGESDRDEEAVAEHLTSPIVSKRPLDPETPASAPANALVDPLLDTPMAAADLITKLEPLRSASLASPDPVGKVVAANIFIDPALQTSDPIQDTDAQRESIARWQAEHLSGPPSVEGFTGGATQLSLLDSSVGSSTQDGSSGEVWPCRWQVADGHCPALFTTKDALAEHVETSHIPASQ